MDDIGGDSDAHDLFLLSGCGVARTARNRTYVRKSKWWVMRILHARERIWFVVDDRASQIHFVIEYGRGVNQHAHETLMNYRVDHWTLRRPERWPLGFYDELQQSIDACALSLGMPNSIIPIKALDGTMVTPAEQKARWEAGPDPRTGRPAEATLIVVAH